MRQVIKNRGISSVLAVLMLAILFALAISFAGTTNQNQLQSANLARAELARVQAEGGLSFLLVQLCAVPVPSNTYGSPLLTSIGNSLAAKLNGTGNLHGATVTVGGSSVSIPPIVTDPASGRSFQATITMDSNSVVRLAVTGTSGTVNRTVQICCNVTPSISAVFNFGVAADGPIQMKGNASLLGANNDHEADVFTAANLSVDVNIFGNADLEGDVSLTGPQSAVSLSNNCTVGGTTGADIWSHVHADSPTVAFPQVDPSVFAPFATYMVNSSNVNSLPNIVQNIHIAANTNPTFNDMTILGVVLIDKPNNVKFTGNAVLAGVIVGSDSAHDPAGTITFAGNSTSLGMDTIPPNLPGFPQQLRTMLGSFILAPGFEVDFAGTSVMASGCMAAESFKFSGTTSGTVAGTIISYGTTTFTETGTSDLIINRLHAPKQPPGFVSQARIVPNMDSYTE